jgi:hypothetical protein
MANPRLALLQLKAKLAAKTVGAIMAQPQYALMAMLAAWLFFELVYWMFNMSALQAVLASSSVSPGDKVAVLASPFTAIFAASGMFVGAMMVLLAIIQGINIAVLAYIMSQQRTINAKAVSGGSLVGILALVGLGCPACGTSLVTPIVAMVASGSAVAVAESITRIALPVALVAGVAGLYYAGLQAANVRALREQVEAKVAA